METTPAVTTGGLLMPQATARHPALGEPQMHKIKIGEFNQNLFFITDMRQGSIYLVYKGAEMSLYPSTLGDRRNRQPLTSQAAVNGSAIYNWAEKSILIDLSLGRTFRWIFIIVDVKFAILGVDFLQFFNLTVDMRQHQFQDTETHLHVQGIVTQGSKLMLLQPPSISLTRWEALLRRLPTPTKPSFYAESPQQSITHFIETTGPAVFTGPRRLGLEKLKVARDGFEHILELGVVRPSSSSWSSPLHMV